MTPVEAAEAALAADRAHADPAIWITRVPDDVVLAQARKLQAAGPRGRLLWGVPFAVKDNIDVTGLPTTAACPGFAYMAEIVRTGRAAFARRRRSADWQDEPRPVRDRPGRHAHALWHATQRVRPFAHSGRIIVRLGLCGGGRHRAVRRGHGYRRFRSRARCLRQHRRIEADGRQRAPHAASCRPAGPSTPCRCSPAAWTRHWPSSASWPASTPAMPIRGAPRSIICAVARRPRRRASRWPTWWSCATRQPPGYAQAAAQYLGAEIIDIAPFLAIARLLYDGPWVAERTAALRLVVEEQPEILHPVTRDILQSGFARLSVDAFDAFHRLAENQACRGTTVLDLRRLAAADGAALSDAGGGAGGIRSA